MKQILSTITALLAMVMIGHSQANRQLSNLLPTAVNAHLLPGATGTIDLGSNAYRWRNGYFNGSVTAYGVGGSYGVYGAGTSYGLFGSGGTYGVYGSGTSYGVRGVGGTTGVYGSGTSYGVRGQGGTYGVYGNGTSYGVRGISTDGWGLYGSSTSDYGVRGVSTNGIGGRFHSTNQNGLWASTSSTAANEYAGVFDRDVYVFGTVLNQAIKISRRIYRTLEMQ